MDHRILLSVYVLANVTGCKVLIHGFSAVDSSFPSWLKLQKNSKELVWVYVLIDFWLFCMAGVSLGVFWEYFFCKFDVFFRTVPKITKLYFWTIFCHFPILHSVANLVIVSAAFGRASQGRGAPLWLFSLLNIDFCA